MNRCHEDDPALDDEERTEDDEDEDEETEEPGIPRLAKVVDIEPDLPEEVQISRIESLIFAFPEPITVRRLGRLLGLEGRRVRELIQRISETYAERGIVLCEVSGGYQFQTHPDNAAVVRDALKVKPMRISRPALETLAIVAYRQPVTRADVEDIRRVDCGGTLKFLFEKRLIRVLGRKEEPGRPIIYGTSQEFLELFGLKSLSDLPSLREFSELWDEHQEIVDDLSEDEGLASRVGEPGEEEANQATAQDQEDGQGQEDQEDQEDEG